MYSKPESLANRHHRSNIHSTRRLGWFCWPEPPNTIIPERTLHSCGDEKAHQSGPSIGEGSQPPRYLMPLDIARYGRYGTVEVTSVFKAYVELEGGQLKRSDRPANS